jgi:hypothetical protein
MIPWIPTVDVIERTDPEVWDEWDRLTAPAALDTVTVRGETPVPPVDPFASVNPKDTRG